ncbi:Hypothetical protein GbCGDNIH6_7329 [Granulibacter bethesdensis]|nr:Hypothetical protein GbCGDNIH6_7329 [Granulibacter bethesdensis]
MPGWPADLHTSRQTRLYGHPDLTDFIEGDYSMRFSRAIFLTIPALIATSGLLGLTGCEREAPMQRAGAALDRAGTKTGEAVGTAADKTGKAMNNAGQWVDQKVNDNK